MAEQPLAKVAGLFVASILALSLGYILLGIGMDQVEKLAPKGVWPTLRATLLTWQIPVGMVLMTAQFVGMLALFKWGLDVSVVVPVFGLNYVVTALLSQAMLGEPVRGVRWLGIAAIVLGVSLVARSVEQAPK